MIEKVMEHQKSSNQLVLKPIFVGVSKNRVPVVGRMFPFLFSGSGGGKFEHTPGSTNIAGWKMNPE